MPMMIPPGQGVTVTTPAGQVTTPGPASSGPASAAQAPPPPRSPFRQEIPPDLVIMPHLDAPQTAAPAAPAPGNSPQPA